LINGSEVSMKRPIALLGILITSTLLATPPRTPKTPKAPSPRTSVRPHIKKNGTYVPRHQRTAPNSTKRDNWSTRGNVNPNTGKPGSKPAYP
jgi:hypothetical protein